MRTILFSLFGFIVFGAAAQEPLPEFPPMREVSPGIFEVGKLRLEKAARLVIFPAKINKAGKEDQLEYLLVTPKGSSHESLLVTDVQPSDLHLAMLLLDAKGAGLATPDAKDKPPAQINAEYLRTAPALPGDRIFIDVRWGAGKDEKTVPVEDLLFNRTTNKAAERGPWIYTGSMIVEGRFLAQVEGCFVALVTYPGALINNPRKGKEDDSGWIPNIDTVPPVETPVQVLIKLPIAP